MFFTFRCFLFSVIIELMLDKDGKDKVNDREREDEVEGQKEQTLKESILMLLLHSLGQMFESKCIKIER